MAHDSFDTPFDLIIREELEGFVRDLENFSMNLEEISPCSGNIYPTVPTQIGKTYHMYRERGETVVPSDGGPKGFMIRGNGAQRLDYRSHYCRDQELGMRAQSRDLTVSRLLICRVPDIQYMYLMSDTYVDDCDRYFRGYWLEEFRASEDIYAAGGPATSPGRTTYLKQQDQFSFQVPVEGAQGVRRAQLMGHPYEGDTHVVNRDRFDFFGPLLPQDSEQIQRYRSEALEGRRGEPPTHRLSDSNPRLYIYIGER